MSEFDEIRRQRLCSAIVKLRRRGTKIELWPHEAEALFAELCRLSNYATLLGNPSPAEVAGIFTREECERIAAEAYPSAGGPGKEAP